MAEMRELLEQVSIFLQLDSPDLDRLVALASVRHLRTREVLCRKGDPGAQAYVIISGRLKVSSAGEDGRETVLRIMKPGDVVGEIALLDGEPRSATVAAMEPVALLVLQRRDVLPFLRKYPETAIKLLESAAGLLRAVTAQLEEQVFLSVTRRLAKLLVPLAADYGGDTPKGLRIGLKLSQSELGEMVGTSRESINKQLRAWSEEGVIEQQDGVLTLCKLEELERQAGGPFT